MFNFIKEKLTKLYSHVTGKLQLLFAKPQVDSESLQALEKALIESDVGAHTTQKIIEAAQEKCTGDALISGADLKEIVREHLLEIMNTTKPLEVGNVVVMVGINGSGKTTFSAKLAQESVAKGKRVLLVAADTFRAAATEQLEQWAKKCNVDIVIGQEGSDPGSVVYRACQQYKTGNYNTLIIDTAGRLQTKINLMKELEKIHRIIGKQLPKETITTLLTVDAMLGQNSLEQARLFHESTDLNGVVLTKMDGTGKGGIVFAIAQRFKIPVAYLSFGERPGDFKLFEPKQFITDLLGS